VPATSPTANRSRDRPGVWQRIAGRATFANSLTSWSAIVFEDRDELDFLTARRHLRRPRIRQLVQRDVLLPEQGFDLEQAIKRLIDHALTQTGNNVSAAARCWGDRDYLRYRLPEKSGHRDGRNSGRQARRRIRNSRRRQVT
jgi:hypothetical protein